jgi:hypothetical protein
MAHSDRMSYRLAKWLFPKMRPDQSIQRLNLIILVTVVTVGTAGAMVAIILLQYSQSGK